ncbi:MULTISPECIES: hypothetical protein [unclassified Bradyrhizobium]|nr:MULTISPECIES: hypothetical protein [unclassified Bradyrhizobium]
MPVPFAAGGPADITGRIVAGGTTGALRAATARRVAKGTQQEK